MKQIRLGFSSCPNDTYIFFGLVNNRVCKPEFQFRPVIEDIQTLNSLVLNGDLDVSKVSIHAAALVTDEYVIFSTGGALGQDCGPLLVGKKPIPVGELSHIRIAIPGRHTTAALLLGIYDHNLLKNTVEVPFHQIPQKVKDGEVDAGVIIHETRFTYHLYGLEVIVDLGNWWYRSTGLPIPLGVVVARRSLSESLKDIQECIRQSILHAKTAPPGLYRYIKEYAQELSEDIINRHINTFVNSFTLELGETGKEAILRLFREAAKRQLLPESSVTEGIFL